MPTTRRQLLLSTGALAGASALPIGVASQVPVSRTNQDPSEEVAQALSVWDFKAIAENRLPEGNWAEIIGGAADEITMRWNRKGFDRIALRPRTLVEVTPIDLRIRLFGQEMPFPILVAPTGSHRGKHPEGELATAKGAGQAGATMVISTMANTSVEDIARVATRPLWFQLYVLRDRPFTRDLVQRAENAGCQAICVTVDTPTLGPRDRQFRTPGRLPAGVSSPHLHGLESPGRVESPIFSAVRDPNVTWKDIDWIRSFAKVPVLVKGILDSGDAARAVEEEVDGIVVSNHGGRNLDTAPATIDVLPEIAEQVGGAFPVLLDGGVRRGTDVLKALALGASAVLVGRASLYGLVAGGAAGVSRVLEILRTELEMAMALTGRRSIAALDPTVIRHPRETERSV